MLKIKIQIAGLIVLGLGALLSVIFQFQITSLLINQTIADLNQTAALERYREALELLLYNDQLVIRIFPHWLSFLLLFLSTICFFMAGLLWQYQYTNPFAILSDRHFWTTFQWLPERLQKHP